MNSCPWVGFAPSTLSFCEEALCFWIKTPANTWSNLGYVLAGIYLVRKAQGRPQSPAGAIGYLAFLTGIMSFAYHASLIFVTEVLDIGSMILLSTLFLSMNLLRLKVLNARVWWPFYLLLNAISVGLLIVVKTSGIWIFGAQLGVSILLEIVLARRQSEPTQYSSYFMALGLFGLSYGIWILDFQKVICNPTNHFIQGHAIWHTLNAVAYIPIYQFYVQFSRIDT